MKRKISLLMVLIMILSFGALSAQAATVVQRLEKLETAISLPLPDETIISRVQYLELQLGLTPAKGATFEARIAALEAALGVGVSYPMFDNGVYAETVPLTSIGYFTKDDHVLEAEGGYTRFDTDNYGNAYGTLIHASVSEGGIEYRLDKEYSALMCTLYVTDTAVKEGHDHQWQNAAINFYADDVLIYSATGFTAKSEPLPLMLDVQDVQFLRIEFDRVCYYNTGREHPLVAVGNPMLVPTMVK